MEGGSFEVAPHEGWPERHAPQRTDMDSNSICRRKVTVKVEDGLHLGPCSDIAKTASQFRCAVRLLAGEKKADAKAVLDILSMGIQDGTELTIEAEGEGAEEAVEKLAEIFEQGFRSWAKDGAE